jgi:hypothetical protein
MCWGSYSIDLCKPITEISRYYWENLFLFISDNYVKPMMELYIQNQVQVMLIHVHKLLIYSQTCFSMLSIVKYNTDIVGRSSVLLHRQPTKTIINENG